MPFAVILRETGKPIGSTRYLRCGPSTEGSRSAGRGWAGPRGGTGANTETKLLLLGHAFETLGCMRVEFKTDAKNARSRTLSKPSARFEGIFRKHMLVQDGQLRDSAWYAITDDEWPEVRAALERRVRQAVASCA